MVKRSKRYEQAAQQVDRSRTYGPKEALDLLKQLPKAKFDESVEVVVRLGIDPR
jgi:large subunit ribosomal protein L1